MIEQIGKSVDNVVAALKDNPVLLSLLLLNVIFIAAIVYILKVVDANNREDKRELFGLQKEIRQLEYERMPLREKP